MNGCITINQLCKLINSKKLSFTKKNVCGELLDFGLHRNVYILKQNPHYVVKEEKDLSQGYYCNIMEFRTWINNKEWTTFSKWLAPSVMMRKDGYLLIQKRVRFYEKREYPSHIPSLFTDLKRTNFGWIGNRLVCCDYAFLLMNNHSLRLKKAKWWNEVGHMFDYFERAKIDRNSKKSKS